MKKNIVVLICLSFIDNSILGMGGNASQLFEAAKKIANSQEVVARNINEAESTKELIDAYTEAHKAFPTEYPEIEYVKKIIKIFRDVKKVVSKPEQIAPKQTQVMNDYIKAYINLKETLNTSFIKQNQLFEIIKEVITENEDGEKGDLIIKKVMEQALSDISAKTNPLDLRKDQVNQAIEKLKTSKWFDFKERAEARKTIRNHLNDANKTLADIKNEHGNKFIDQNHQVNAEINRLQTHINETHQNFHSNLTFVDKFIELFR